MSQPSLFTATDEGMVPSELCRGPWDPRHCHGGPVAALVARAVERVDRDRTPWSITRMTIELTRPVQVLRPLQVDVETERMGRKVSLVAVHVMCDDIEVAKARCLCIRSADVALPPGTPGPDDEPFAPPDAGVVQRPLWSDPSQVAFHSHGCEQRAVRGTWEALGPIDMWIRLLVPVVAGEEPTGLQRAVSAADFGNGISHGLPYEEYLFINADLTVHLGRAPVGEWIGLRSTSMYGPNGSGVAESALFDEHGRVGRSVQSLIVDQREHPL